MPGRRSANGRSSIYLGRDGKWHGRVTMGVRDDGKPDRRHCEGKTQSEVTAKVRALEKERDKGRVRKPGQRWKVGAWLEHWVKNIAAPPAVSENTQAGYEVDVRKHLVPGVGAHWLVKLGAGHLEKRDAKLLESGLSAGTVNHIHRTARASLNEAARRGHVGSNPALIAKTPPLDEEEEVEPYEVEEIRKLLEGGGQTTEQRAVGDRHGARAPAGGGTRAAVVRRRPGQRHHAGPPRAAEAEVRARL